MSSAINGNISRLRKQTGITQEQLANRLGISYQAVSKWENGQSCPDIILIPELADIFGITIDELFGRSMKGIDLRHELVLEYLFDGDVLDSSGAERHGRLEGAQFCKDRFGRDGSALYFDGKDDYVIIDPPPSLSDEGFSVSVWCYYDAQTTFDGWNSAIISQDGHKENRVFQLSTKDEYMTFHRFLLHPDLSMTAKIQKERWYHIIVTYKDHRFRKYVNGILVVEREGHFTPNDAEPIYIGRKSTDEPYFFFRGKIDDIRIYNRAVHQSEVEALFLEHGWRPESLPKMVLSEESIPVLESLDCIRMILSKGEVHNAAKWYREYLGFKSLTEEEDFYILSLYKGPSLILESVDHKTFERSEQAAFIFKTKRDMGELRMYLSEAGADVGQVRDEGFAFFLDFQDPFGQCWMVIREK